MKENTDRFHLILSAGDSNRTQIRNSSIKGVLCVKLLGVKFDHKWVFGQNVKSICKKAKAKLKALARVVLYIITEKNLVMISFFAAQFNYWPLDDLFE